MTWQVIISCTFLHWVTFYWQSGCMNSVMTFLKVNFPIFTDRCFGDWDVAIGWQLLIWKCLYWKYLKSKLLWILWPSPWSFPQICHVCPIFYLLICLLYDYPNTPDLNRVESPGHVISKALNWHRFLSDFVFSILVKVLGVLIGDSHRTR